mgnify:CR=1 FL=1
MAEYQQLICISLSENNLYCIPTRSSENAALMKQQWSDVLGYSAIAPLTLLECSEGCCFKCMFIMDGFPLSQSACTLFEESIVFFQRERGKTVHSRRLSPNRTFLLRLWTCFLDRLKKKVRSRRLFMTSQRINVLL